MTNIVLTGFMGTGKSTVGRLLARRMELKFMDMDELIEADSGMTVAEIFASSGEASFRALERALVGRLASGEFGSGIVLSTGGGAVADPANRAALKGWGAVVCLVASVEEILRRVGDRGGRPLLERPDRREAIEELLKGRSEAYRDCHLSIDTTGLRAEEVASMIEAFVRGRNKS